MPLLLLSPRFTPDSAVLREAARRLGWSTWRSGSWRLAEDFEREGEPVVYGEPLFAEAIAEQWPFALIEPDPEALARMPADWLLRRVRAMTLAEARRERGPVFIKPADSKCFPAKVYGSGAELPSGEGLLEAEPALVSEPVQWDVEFRAFVSDGAVRAFSPYWRAGGFPRDEDGRWSDPREAEARRFVETILAAPDAGWPPAMVLDAGWIRDRGWAVVELNPAYASGIYGCDPAGVLEVARRACRPPGGLTPEESKWVRRRGGTLTSG